MARAQQPQPPNPDGEPIPKWVDNKVQLAAVLHTSRQTLYNWEKIPFCPSPKSNGKYLVEEWIEFRDSQATTSLGGSSLMEKAELEARKLKIQCERLEWQFACERNEWTPNATIADEVRRLVAEAASVLRDELELKLPKRAAKKSETEIREFVKVAIDAAMLRLHRGAADIVEKHPAPPAEAAP